MRLLTLIAAAAASGGAPGDDERRRRPMFWMHIHNAGGTTIRTLAERYGERPIQPATPNWNIVAEKYSGDVVWSCDAKTRLIKTQAGASWTAIERPLDLASDFGCDFDYGVTIRDPVDTMVSTMVNNAVDVEGLVELLRTRKGRKIRRVAVPRTARSHVGHVGQGLEHNAELASPIRVFSAYFI